MDIFFMFKTVQNDSNQIILDKVIIRSELPWNTVYMHIFTVLFQACTSAVDPEGDDEGLGWRPQLGPGGVNTFCIPDSQFSLQFCT